MENIEKLLKEEPFNINLFVRKILNKWYLFCFSFPLFLIGTFLHLRYSNEIFSTQATVLVRDKHNQMASAENILDELKLFSSKKNLVNEIEVLKSFSLINKTIKKLNFQTSFFVKGSIKTFELYDNPPYIVKLDSNFAQATNKLYFIKSLTDSTYQITATDEGSHEVLVCKYGQLCSSKNFSFTIFPNESFELTKINSSDNIYFIINNIDVLTRQYMEKLHVEPVNKDASVLRLEIKGTVIQKEIDFVNQLSNEYILSDLEEKNSIATNTLKFIDDQLIESSKSLNGAESQLENFRQKNKVIDLGLATKNSFEKLIDLDRQKAMLFVKDKYYDYLINYLNSNTDLNKIVAPSAMEINDALLVSLIEDLKRLYSEKASLNFSVHENNPSMNLTNLKIKNAQKSLIENLNVIKKSSKIAMDAIEARITEINNSLSQLPKTERDLLSIQRKFSLNDHIYNYLLEKRAEVGIAKSAYTPDNKILDIARYKTPISPNKKLFYFVAIVLALVVPIGFILISDLLNDSIRTKEDLTKVSLIPILGLISHNDKKSSKPLLDQPKSVIAESFRTLRINLKYLNSNIQTKTIGITSSISGEGKTFSAINLSTAIALSGSKTILIGADLRKPKLTNEFNLNNEFGLSSYLINKNTIENIIHKTHIENLDIIPSGPIPPNPTELLGSQNLESLFQYLKSNYDYIVVDTPPINLVADYFILKDHIDAHLYIVRSGYTKKTLLEGLNELKKKENFKNLFLVLNDFDPHINGYGNYYGYGYGYGYGYYEQAPKKNILSRLKKIIKKS